MPDTRIPSTDYHQNRLINQISQFLTLKAQAADNLLQEFEKEFAQQTSDSTNANNDVPLSATQKQALQETLGFLNWVNPLPSESQSYPSKSTHTTKEVDTLKGAIHLLKLNHHSRQETINNMSTGGYCNGLAALWLYYKLYPNASNANYFFDLLKQISTWDQQTLSPEIETTFTKLHNLMDWFQRSMRIMPTISQIMLHQSSSVANEQPLHDDGPHHSFSLLIPRDQLVTLLTEFFEVNNDKNHAGKGALLGCHGHATAVYINALGTKPQYIYYDSNEENGEKYANSIEELAECFLESSSKGEVNYRTLDYIPISISIFRRHDQPVGQYPSDEVLIDKLLEQDPNLLQAKTPLTYLASLKFSQRFSTAKYLITKGADVNETSKFGLNRLFAFVIQANHDAVKYLLTHAEVEVNPQVTENKLSKFHPSLAQGATPLHYAAAQGLVEILETLLTHHANPNILTSDYHITPLAEAINSGHTACARLLLKHGADPNQTNKYSMTPLVYAALANNLDSAKVLLEHTQPPVDINVSINYEGTYDLVTMARGYTALHLAVLRNNFEMVELLVNPHNKQASTIEIDKASEQGITALYLAAQQNNDAIVTLLLAKGADIYQALSSAALKGDVQTFNYLAAMLENLDPEHQDSGGTMLITQAVLGGNEKIVEQLLKNSSIDLSQTLIPDETLCSAYTEPDRLSALMHAGIQLIHLAAIHNNPAVLDTLLDHGADIHATTQAGQNCAHIAVAFENTLMLNFLNFKKLNFNLQDNNNYSPLLLASRNPFINPAVITNLLKFGKTSINQPTANGITPLMLSLLVDNKNLAQQLINEGADLTITLKADYREKFSPLPSSIKQHYYAGITPAHLICLCGDIGLIKTALKKGFDLFSPIKVVNNNDQDKTDNANQQVLDLSPYELLKQQPQPDADDFFAASTDDALDFLSMYADIKDISEIQSQIDKLLKDFISEVEQVLVSSNNKSQSAANTSTFFSDATKFSKNYLAELKQTHEQIMQLQKAKSTDDYLDPIRKVKINYSDYKYRGKLPKLNTLSNILSVLEFLNPTQTQNTIAANENWRVSL
ncbi:MAG: hypothetical protein Tsb005_08480 [Gammaproteobacteria bacterium]